MRDGFSCRFIPSLLKHEWYRPAYHVNRTVHTADVEYVQAEIPPIDAFPQYAEKCVLISLPSLDYWQRKADVYHRYYPCEATSTVSHVLEGAWNEDESRQVKWYLIVFSEPINNTHFSQSSEPAVATNDNMVKLDADADDNLDEQDIYGTVLFWELALKTGGHPQKKTASAKKSRAERRRDLEKSNQVV